MIHDRLLINDRKTELILCLLKTFGARSFQAAAPYLWNRLPHEIRMIKCLDKFKKAIKTLYKKPFFYHFKRCTSLILSVVDYFESKLVFDRANTL